MSASRFTVSSRFQLLELPQNGQCKALQSMDFLSLISFSFTSQNATKLVKSLNLKASRLLIMISDDVYVCIALNDYIELFFTLTNVWTRGAISVVMYENLESKARFDWKQPEFKIKDCVSHLQDIFRHGQGCEIILRRNNLQSLYGELHGLTAQKLYMAPNRGSQPEALKMLKEHAEQLIFEKYPLFYYSAQNSKEHHETFLRNLKKLVLPAEHPLGLNDLLVMNSRVIGTKCITHANVLNLFLKHWVNGLSPQLKHFWTKIATTRNTNRQELIQAVLKGMEYEMTSEETKIRLRNGNAVGIEEGFVIHGCNSTQARLTFTDEGRFFRMCIKR